MTNSDLFIVSPHYEREFGLGKNEGGREGERRIEGLYGGGEGSGGRRGGGRGNMTRRIFVQFSLRVFEAYF